MKFNRPGKITEFHMKRGKLNVISKLSINEMGLQQVVGRMFIRLNFFNDKTFY